MEWTLRGWLWYLRGTVCRRFGPNKNLISSLLLVVICVSFLSGYHITFFGGHEEVILGNFESSLESSGQYDETELAEQNRNFDYIEDEEEPPMNSQGYPNISSKPLPLKNNKREPGGRNNLKKKKKKKKGFKLNVNVKKGSISSRTDKLMFPRSDSRTDSRNQLLPLRNNQKTGPLNYQRDVIIGDNIEWTLEVEQERRRELRQRSLRVRRECEQDVRGRLKRKMGIVYEHLNWVTRYDLIWCPVFKAGSTTWMKNLLILAGETRFNGSLHHKANSLYPAPTSTQRAQNLLDKSLKFMIVRHPFDRLLSAYRDKMLRVLKIDDPYRRLQLQILEKYRDIGSRRSPTETTKEQKEEQEQEEQEKESSFGDSTKDTDHPTFLQFLYKVRDDMKYFWQIMDGNIVDPHWTPYWYYCAPCQVHYDIIAKVETLDLDQEFIIRAANLQGILRNARTHASKFDGYTDSEAAAARYFGQVPVELLKELEELYWPDFKLYGYTSEKYLQMAKSDA